MHDGALIPLNYLMVLGKSLTLAVVANWFLTAATLTPVVAAEAQGLDASNNEPLWYTRRPRESNALYGCGKALNPLEAQDMARVEIANQILSSLESQRHSQTSQSMVITNETEDVRTVSEFAQEIITKTQARFLPGVEIVQQEKVGSITYIMMKLDKTKFQAAAAARIEQIDRSVQKLPSVDSNRITGAKLSALRRALPIVEEREWLAITLAGMGHRTPPSPITSEAIRSQLGFLIIPGTIVFKGDSSATAVRDAVASCLSDLDLSVVDSDSNARFELKLQEKKTTTTLPNGWVKVHFTGTVTVINTESQETIGSISTGIHATNISETAANAQAREKFINAMAEEIKNKLLKILIRGAPEE